MHPKVRNTIDSVSREKTLTASRWQILKHLYEAFGSNFVGYLRVFLLKAES